LMYFKQVPSVIPLLCKFFYPSGCSGYLHGSRDQS
jgi:hypothetical protein